MKMGERGDGADVRHAKRDIRGSSDGGCIGGGVWELVLLFFSFFLLDGLLLMDSVCLFTVNGYLRGFFILTDGFMLSTRKSHGTVFATYAVYAGEKAAFRVIAYPYYTQYYILLFTSLSISPIQSFLVASFALCSDSSTSRRGKRGFGPS